MNTPAQTTTNGTASTAVSAAACVACLLTITNNHASQARCYVVIDAAAAPALPTAPNVMPAGTVWTSGVVAAQATVRLSPLNATQGVPFTKGLVVMSFALDSSNTPISTALSAADANVLAWTAPLA